MTPRANDEQILTCELGPAMLFLFLAFGNDRESYGLFLGFARIADEVLLLAR